VQAPVVIQYGPTLQSFKEVPVTIGTSPRADFTIDHPAVLEQHGQIFFYQNQYWVKDLTGQNKLFINKLPIAVQAPLNVDDELALSPEGPFFRFLGGGRLAEVEVSAPEEPLDAGAESEDQETTQEYEAEVKPDKGAKSILKKFLR
jgi:pSer/pThr/pTyr-binding forkhead associated (FHA) protein